MKSKYFGSTDRLSSISLAAFLFVTNCLTIGSALAEGAGKDESVQEGAKSIEKGFGELLKGMGQEMKKIIGPEDATTKTDAQTKAKSAEKESKPNSEKPK